MSPIVLKKLLLASLLPYLFEIGTAIPTASPENQYLEHAIRKRAELHVLKTTNTKSQIIDWIPIESQGDIAQAPPPRFSISSTQSNNASRPISDLEMPGAERGPSGTVPIPRVNLDYLANGPPRKQLPDMLSANDKSKRQNAGTHWYVSSNQNVANHGGKATFSLFDAYVANSGDFSLLQTAILKTNVPLPGNPSQTGSQTLEAGWINYPNQVQEPHLFTFFTTNGYTQNGDNIGGWNTDVKGWVQTDSTYFPGMVFSPTSVDGGTQYALELEYYLFEGNWWLWVIDRYVGYYPGSMYSANEANAGATLAAGSDAVFFYGEIYQSEGPVTTTDMGSGHFAGTGYGHSAYMHNMLYIDTSNVLQQYTAGFWDSDSARYNHDAHPNTGEAWGSYVYLGGPGAGGVVNG